MVNRNFTKNLKKNFFFKIVYENGNHSTYQDDDECDSSSHPRKISLDEDILPPTMTVDEEEDEPGMNEYERILFLMSTR
jgi:hypothetical protein